MTVRRKRRDFVTVFAFIVYGCQCASSFQCRNEQGKPVDWFVAYKLPKIPESSNELIRQGLGHFYLDVNSPSWRLSAIPVNSTGHAIYNTLQQIYSSKNDNNTAYVMYNDEKPTGEKTEYYGHTKGVLGFEKSGGFWLVQSTPKFPPARDKGYDWPDNGLEYGQSFLCVTYDYDKLDIIGNQFRFNHPWVYDSYLPPAFRIDNPNMAAYLNSSRAHVKDPPWNNLAKLVSKGGEQFYSFAKYNNFSADLYSAWLAPYFRSSLLTETWQNGGGDLESNCTGTYKVYNVEKISLPDGVDFSETKDHSKWAVTQNSGPPWICIGDINRQEHQIERGGGTVCFKNQDVRDQFQKSVAGFEKCK